MKYLTTRLLWWGLYIVAALIIQQRVPGLDALVPGFLIALHEDKPWQTCWLFVAFILIQEGGGSLHFGSAVLWYGGQIVLFRSGQRLFVADNFVFILFISVCLGGYHYLLIRLLCEIQNIPFEQVRLLNESSSQAVSIPIIWLVAQVLRPRSESYGRR